MTKKLTHLNIQLNKEVIKKLKDENKTIGIAETLMKEMIREAILTNATTLNISLEMSHKDIGKWLLSANIVKVKK
jgi:hypothetical protein